MCNAKLFKNQRKLCSVFLIFQIKVKNRNLLIQLAAKYKPKTPADSQVNQNRLLTTRTFSPG